MKLNKRKANLKKDKEILLFIAQKSFNNSFEPSGKSDKEFLKSLEMLETYIYFYNKKPVGFFSCKLKNKEVYLEIIAVVKNFKKRGVGKQMVKEFIAIAKGRRAYIFTNSKNTAAIILYLKLGFEIYNWKEDYLGDGIPRVFFKLN